MCLSSVSCLLKSEIRGPSCRLSEVNSGILVKGGRSSSLSFWFEGGFLIHFSKLSMIFACLSAECLTVVSQ